MFAAMQYAAFGIISRVVGYAIPLFFQNWTRNSLAAVILVWTFSQWRKIATKDWVWIVLRSLAGTLAFLTFFFAVNVLPVSLTYFMFYGGGILAGYAFGFFMFKEILTRLRVFCLALAITGMMLVYGVTIQTNGWLFVALAALSGVAFQFWNVVSKKVDRYPAAQMTFLDNAIAAGIYILLSLISRERWSVMGVAPEFAASMLLGVLFVTTGLLVVYGFRSVDVQVGSLILLSEIIFATMYSWMYYHEIPSVMAVAGGALIITAMILPEINWKNFRPLPYAHRRKTTGR